MNYLTTNPRLIVIAGPTAVGKTDLSIRLAQHYDAPVISADSRQVYRGMRVGTAQPADKQLAAVRHFFIADREITDRFTCVDFETEALALLEKLFLKHRYVIAVGGSGLYLDALCKGLDDISDVDIETRNALNSSLKTNGLGSLVEQLRELDPLYYEQVDKQNPARVMRALEVCLQTGLPYSSFRTGKAAKRTFDIIKIGVTMDRTELYDRINRRVDMMIADGLEAEARRLYPFRDLPSLQTVGYKELFTYFDGESSFDDAVELIKRNSRRYAKRQMTWFKRDIDMEWFRSEEKSLITNHIDSHQQNLNSFAVK